MKKHIFQPCYAGIFLPGGKNLSLKRVFFLANFENKTKKESCFIQYKGIAPEIIERHLRQSLSFPDHFEILWAKFELQNFLCV